MEWNKHTSEEQEKILKSIKEYGEFIKGATQQKCLHDNCPECHETGKKDNGFTCIHMISCPCPKCSPQYL